MGRLTDRAVLIITAIIICGAIFLWNASQSVLGKKFTGFIISKNLIVSHFNLTHWDGPRAGVAYPDRLIKVNGRRVKKADQFWNLVRQTPVGEELKYTFQTPNNDIKEVSLPVSIFNFNDYLLTFGILFPSGIVLFLIGLVIYRLRTGSEGLLYYLMLVTPGIFFITSFDSDTTYYSPWFMAFSGAVMSAFIFHFALVFPKIHGWVSRRPWILFIIYILAIIPGFFYILSIDDYPKITIASKYCSFLLIILALSFLALNCLYLYVKSRNAVIRKQAFIIFISILLCYAFPLGHLFYSMVTNTPVQITHYVPLVTVVPGGFFWGLSLLLNSDELMKLFFREKHRNRCLIDATSRELTAVLDLELVKKKILEVVHNTFQPSTAILLLLSRKWEQYHVREVGDIPEQLRSLSFSQKSALAKMLLKQMSPIFLDDIIRVHNYDYDVHYIKDFSQESVKLIIPLILKDELVGLLLLGERATREEYTRDDLELLRTLSFQFVLALQNAQTHYKLQNVNKEYQSYFKRILNEELTIIPTVNGAG